MHVAVFKSDRRDLSFVAMARYFPLYLLNPNTGQSDDSSLFSGLAFALLIIHETRLEMDFTSPFMVSYVDEPRGRLKLNDFVFLTA